MDYRIASFNIKDFGRVAVSKDDSAKETESIAKIIRDNELDIIAIQEISSKYALKDLLEKIEGQYAKPLSSGMKFPSSDNQFINNRTNESFAFCTKHWEGRWAAPISLHGKGAAEGYAFIWNKRRIKLVTNYNDKPFEPRIATFNRKNTLVRPPFIGRFMPIRGRCEFRLINTHIAWGATAKMKDENSELYNPDVCDIEMRCNELLTLIENVFANWATKQYDIEHKDRSARYLNPYTFLLGDYNLNLSDSDAKGAKIPEHLARHKYQNMEIITVNQKLTTLKMKSEEAEEDDTDYDSHLANNYDHFSYDEKKLDSPTVEVIYAFDIYDDSETDEKSKYDLYRTKISDHLPIYMNVNRKNLK